MCVRVVIYCKNIYSFRHRVKAHVQNTDPSYHVVRRSCGITQRAQYIIMKHKNYYYYTMYTRVRKSHTSIDLCN